MTLNEWVKNGNSMLSTMCSALCCLEIECNEKQLREMQIHDIYELAPLGGRLAKREIDRSSIECLRRFYNKRVL